MNTKKILIAVTTAGAAIALLAGCSGGNSKFCDLMKDDSILNDFTGTGDLSPVVDKLKEIQAVAPSDLKGDLDTAISGFEKLSGVDLSAVGDSEAATAAQEALASIDMDKWQEALDNVDKKSEDICK